MNGKVLGAMEIHQSSRTRQANVRHGKTGFAGYALTALQTGAYHTGPDLVAVLQDLFMCCALRPPWIPKCGPAVSLTLGAILTC
ncbi:hypothetical protein RRG08_003615 [Elysia crispata]|uniref:Uncharacterized protein n=1 Tax=Elysia crispata TaxID=231223 RepID=A0AAE1E565_9GAST|nr:hypothetical protein RRG08_003615 [Elysia crispata]